MKAALSFVRVALIALLPAALSACQQLASDPTIATLLRAGSRTSEVDNVQLDLRYRYLRLAIDGHPIIIALGFDEASHPGLVETWYGADRQMLRTRSGRLEAAVGFPVEWRSVEAPALPSWAELARAEQSVRWTRVRDVMPGYRYGVRDDLFLRRIDAPPKSELKGIDADKLVWFEESMERSTGKLLPPARYAVDIHDGRELVIYTEQCLTPDTCLAWQRWPVAALRPELRKVDK